jgi:hypothetical protein
VYFLQPFLAIKSGFHLITFADSELDEVVDVFVVLHDEYFLHLAIRQEIPVIEFPDSATIDPSVCLQSHESSFDVI